MSRFARVSLGTVLALTLGLVLFCRSSEPPAAAPKDYQIWNDGTPGQPAVQNGENPVRSFAPLVKTLQPAVVNIATTMEIKGHRMFGRRGGADPRSPGGRSFGSRDPMDDMFRHFFGDPGEAPPMKRNSLGSGFIINADGYILTNNHVVAEATEITIKLVNGETELKAKVIGRDEHYDLALLKVESKEKLPVVDLGDSDRLEVGDWVIAIGSPFGLAHTVTAGIVSAKDRVIGAGPYDDFIQTDASINPGNSGGPLFDATGQVVGINTAIHAGGQGIGFAVPVNMAKQFIRDVMTKGRVQRGWLGVGIQELTPEIAKGLNLDLSAGVLVSQVFPGSPADKAGIKRGDVIVQVGQKKVLHASDLTRAIGLTSPGETAQLKVVRDGKEVTFGVPVVERKAGEVAGMAPPEEGQVAPETGKTLGLAVRAPTAREAERLNLKPGVGVVVDEVADDGPASETGIREGDVVIEVNRAPVKSPADFAGAVARVPSGDSVLLLIARGDNYFYAAVKKP